MLGQYEIYTGSMLVHTASIAACCIVVSQAFLAGACMYLWVMCQASASVQMTLSTVKAAS